MSSGNAKIRVLLLKTRSSPRDGYEELLSGVDGGRFEPLFVPVLEHYFNESTLELIEKELKAGHFSGRETSKTVPDYGGLIFTSQRAVEAFHNIIQKLRAADGVELGELLSAHLPLYVVGPATAKSVRAIDLPNPVVGEDTGNGEALAGFILEHYNAQPGSKYGDGTNRPLLFMVGEKRRDIIPVTLQDNELEATRRIPVIEMTVYETRVMQSFPEQFQGLVEHSLRENAIQWIVVFSPTGCKAMLQGLGMLDAQTGKALPKRAGRTTFIATIGPTTRRYLQHEFDFETDVSADTPSPEGIAHAILAFQEAKC